MKLALVTNASNILEYTRIGADAFIFGFKGYSSGYNNEIDLDEIKKIKQETNKDIFIAINKNLFNHELREVEKILIELDKIKISGVLFYDLSIIYLKNKNNLSIPLVWNQTHLVTNYNTCNYYLEKGCNYGVLSSEITLDEINEITNKTKMKLFLNILGYQIMGYSRRNLVDNYYKSIGKERKKDSYIIKNQNEEYIVSQEKNGNAFYYGKPLNGSSALKSLNVEYLILNDNFFEKEKFINAFKLYKEYLNNKNDSVLEKIDELVGDNRGFLYKKTIYKVKKNG